MLRHLYEILQNCDEVNGAEDLENYCIPVEAVLAISDQWARTENPHDPHAGSSDAAEWDDHLDQHFIAHGPCVVEHNARLYVLAGEWKYPIYWRFEKRCK